MTRLPLLVPLAAAALLAGCTTDRSGPSAAVPLVEATQWRAIATRDDRRRLSDWRRAWVKALGQARTGHRAEIAAEGALLQPDAALAEPAPPAGDYRCRTIKLGGSSGGSLAYAAYPGVRCRIDVGDNGTFVFTKVGGSQRPVGRIFPENSRRMIFLGTLQLGDEAGTLRYGHDKARDLAAIVERVGPRRWRMTFPNPHFESVLDVIELVPAG